MAHLVGVSAFLLAVGSFAGCLRKLKGKSFFITSVRDTVQ
jgi:hypothetical protein